LFQPQVVLSAAKTEKNLYGGHISRRKRSVKDATCKAQKRNTYKVLAGKGGNLKERDNLEGTRPRWEDKIMLDLKHMEWEYV
jgi:hypothetical protein